MHVPIPTCDSRQVEDMSWTLSAAARCGCEFDCRDLSTLYMNTYPCKRKYTLPMQDMLGRGAIWTPRPLLGYAFGGVRNAGIGLYGRCENLKAMLEDRWAGKAIPSASCAVCVCLIMLWTCCACCPIRTKLQQEDWFASWLCIVTKFSGLSCKHLCSK